MKPRLVLPLFILGIATFLIVFNMPGTPQFVIHKNEQGIEVVPTRPEVISNPQPILEKEELPIAPEKEEATSTVTHASYVKVTEGCGPYFTGECLNVRSGPGTGYPVVKQLRTGTVLRSSESTTTAERTWHKITFDEWVRYPERVTDEWFVAADYVEAFEDASVSLTTAEVPTSTKKIVVDRSEQKLYAYDGDAVVMEELVSTGTEFTPTPRGTFTIFRKMPSRYMQGPLPNISDDYYDLPGVPWNLYFTEQGAAIHGTYWHDNFGQQWSHGCVNLPPEKAEELYAWADVGTTVVVQD